MTKYTSFMKDTIYEYIKNKKASNCWNESYEKYLRTFENYCSNNYPGHKKLNQDMVDSWCAKRNTENNKSCSSRICVVISFLKYTNARNITNLNIPTQPKVEKRKYIPHFFTQEELLNFFYACDHIELKKNNLVSKNQQLTVPVFFRLLYSTGMRPTEARLLKVEDVNLDEGIINIKKSKGYNQHYVVLNDLIKEHLVQYDKQINKLYKNRTYFFPTRNNGYHKRQWVSVNFKNNWELYNNSHAIPYDLRHNYAIMNINSWINKGIEFHEKLYYLSKSMGHSSIEATKYYYSLIPRMSDIFKNQINTSFDIIVPGVSCDEQ